MEAGQHLKKGALEYCPIMSGSPNNDKLLIDGQ